MFFKKKNNVDKLNDILKNNEENHDGLSEYSKPKEFSLSSRFPFSKIIKILLIVLGVSLIGLLALLYLFMGGKDNKNENNTNENIKLNIISTNIDLDGKLSYEVSFKNNQKFSVQYANLEIRLPKEFVFLDSDIVSDSISENYMKWSFKDIAPSQEIKFNINGLIFGKVSSEVIMSSVLTYKLYNISSTFTSSSDYSILITRSLIDVVVDRPQKIESGRDFEYKIKIRNNAGKVFNNVGVKFDYNSNYFNVLNTSEEAKKQNDNEILFVFDLNKSIDNSITDVTNDEYYQKIIIIKGSITNDKISSADFNVSLGIIADVSNLDNIEYLIEKPDSFQLANSGFTFNVSSSFDITDVNGYKTALIDDISKQYKLTLKYKKDSDQAVFKNARIILEFVGDDIFSFDKVEYTGSPSVIKNEQSGLMDNIIEWSYGNLNNLKDISITENSIDISIPFDSEYINSKDGSKSLIVNLSVYGFDNSNNEILLYKNPSFKIAIDSRFNISANIRYYDENNIQVGFGPNPPKVGQETKYRVDFNVNSKYNNLSDIVLNIKLPNYTVYSYDYSTSNGFDLVYDENANTVEWDIKSLAKNDSITGFFFVNVIPSKDLLNKPIQVIDNINTKYTDSDLNVSFNKDFGAIVGQKVTN